VPKIYGPFPAKVASIHDGDTLSLDVDLGFNHIVPSHDIYGRPQISCRVYGINAPELKTQAGKDALAFLETLVAVGDFVTVVSHGWDKYGGRFDGVVTLADGRDLGQTMLDAGQAVPLKVRN